MKGKVAVITASSTGIGKGIAESLAKQGVKVIISSREKKNVDQTVAEFKAKGYEAYGIVCHVGKKADRQNLLIQTLQKYGKIDFLVPNAAVSTHMGKFLSANDDQIQKMLEINYKSTYFLVQQALPYLKRQKAASIVIISSIGAYEPNALIGHYSITKTMLVALTKILAKELLYDQITVNCVCPGLIKTKFSQPLWSHQGQKKAAQKAGIPRIGLPEDIGDVVKFLLSDDARYMTGQSIVVAGKPISRL